MIRAILLTMFVAASASGAIPSTNIYPWEGNIGIPGGIPDSSAMTVFSNVTVGISTANLRTVIAACPSNQVIQLGAGSWDVTIDAQGLGQGKVIRGTVVNGTNATVFNNTFRSIYLRTTYDSGFESTFTNVSSDALEGDTTISLANGVPSWIKVNYLYQITALNDDVNVTSDSDLTCQEEASNGVVSSSRGRRQTIRVVSKTASSITIEMPLAYPFYTSNTCRIIPALYNPNTAEPLKRWGIENIKFIGVIQRDGVTITMESCDNCWVKDCDLTYVPGTRHLDTHSIYRCQFFGNYIYNGFHFDGGHGYGLSFDSGSTGNLAENNIFGMLHVAMQANYGSCANVFGYNFELPGTSDSASKETDAINTHGCHTSKNLWEGNVTWDKAFFDVIHGSSSHNTLFRNRIYGINNYDGGVYNQGCIQVAHYNRFMVIAGNVSGSNNFHNVYWREAPESCNSTTDRVIYTWGHCNPGGCNTGCLAGSTNGCYESFASLQPYFDWNYDVLTATNNGIVYGAADHTYPASLYLSAKPDWFGDRPWPPIDPTSPSTAVATNIPAGYRYTFGTNPPSSSSPAPPPQVTRARIRPA